MSTRVWPAAALGLWLAWTAWVAAHTFTIPGDRLFVLDAPLRFPHFWREAAIRNLLALAGAAAVMLAAWGGGTLLLGGPAAGLFTRRGERPLFVLAAGLGAIASLGVALAVVHAYRPSTIGAAVGILALGGLAAIGREERTAFAWPRLAGRDRLVLAVAALAAGCALVGALAPETEYDALWYHLWLPDRWLAAGRPVDIVEEYISLYPLSWEMVYGAAMAVGGAGAAKLMHWACLPLLGGATAMLTRQLFPRASAPLAAAVAVTAPIVIWEGTTAYVDLALTWFLALAIYAALRHDATGDRRWIVLAAAMFGIALGIKHLALVALAIAAGALLLRGWRRADSRGALRRVALLGGIALLLPLPWYARAFAASGNPVFPELYGVFGARPAARWTGLSQRGLERFKSRFGGDRERAWQLRLPWNVTVHPARYGGAIGPLFLVLLPAAFVPRRRASASLAVAAGGSIAYAAVWASPLGSLQMRLLIPILPLLAALAAEGEGRIGRAAARVAPAGRAAATAVVVALLLANLPPAVEWHERDRRGWSGWLTHVVRGLPVAVVVGAESERGYLSRTVPSYRAWSFINDRVPADARVLTFSGGDHLYSRRARIWSDSAAAWPATWGAPAGSETGALRAAEALGVTHVLVDKRQLEDGTAQNIAMTSDRMRLCCLQAMYEDDRFAVYALQTGHSVAARDGVPTLSPSPPCPYLTERAPTSRPPPRRA